VETPRLQGDFSLERDDLRQNRRTGSQLSSYRRNESEIGANFRNIDAIFEGNATPSGCFVAIGSF